MADKHSLMPALTLPQYICDKVLQALSENVFIRADIAYSAFEKFCLMGFGWG